MHLHQFYVLDCEVSQLSGNKGTSILFLSLIWIKIYTTLEKKNPYNENEKNFILQESLAIMSLALRMQRRRLKQFVKDDQRGKHQNTTIEIRIIGDSDSSQFNEGC